MGNIFRSLFGGGDSEIATFTTKCIDAETNTFEIKGTMGSKHLAYTVNYTKVHAHHVGSAHAEAFVTKQKERELSSTQGPNKVAAKPPPKAHKYSTGVHLFQKAIVKRIPCDQLYSLAMHKERSVGNRERKDMVVRKLHSLGGWIRQGRHKDRIFVMPNTPLPDYLRPKTAKQTTASFELGFQ